VKRSVVLRAALSVLLAACSKGPPSAGTIASAEPAPSASATTSASAAPALVLRPPEGAAARENREKAALALLSGKARAADLPLVDADQGETFDPDARQAQRALGRGVDIRIGAITATGISDKAIRPVVERQMRRFRRCYGGGLRFNPNLQGRVTARVIVKRAGKPERVENAGTDLPDGGVMRCVLAVYEQLDFPAPEGSEATVTVPVMFSPGD
jgi:hypothetical protein